MKTLLLLFATTFVLVSAKAQFTQNFEGSESSLTGNCWTLSGINITNDPADVITGSGSIYTNPPTSGVTRDITSPALNITSTSFTVSFNYKVSSKISGLATRTIEVGIVDVSGNFTSLQTIIMDNNSPTTVQNFNQTFTLASTGVKKLVLKLGGASGDGNSRLIIDNIWANVNAMYGSGTCNSAPIAVNDLLSGVTGAIVTGNVITNDNEPNGEVMTSFIVQNSNDGNVVLNSNGTFTFTPRAGFTGSSTTFTYKLVDNGFDPLTSNTATVTINFFANASTLPVKLISFDAKYNKPNVTLNWSTAMEKNFSHFVVEYSTDGANFNQVAVVFGAGESDSRNDYTYVDKNLTGKSGLIYYRLKSVDMDGKASYSSIRIIRLGEEQQGIILTTYPNPVSNELRITIPGNWQGKKITYEVFNSNGQISKRSETASSSQTENLNVSALAPGFYIVKVTCDGQSAQQKIVKH
jgi:Secretion system C-terminal sorting domain/Bacterial Ig domain